MNDSIQSDLTQVFHHHSQYRPVSLWLMSANTTVVDHLSFLLQLLVKMIREEWSFSDVKTHVQQFWYHTYDSDARIKYENAEYVIEIHPQSHRLFYKKFDTRKNKRLSSGGGGGGAFEHIMIQLDAMESQVSQTYQRLYRQFYDTPPRFEHIQFLFFIAHHPGLSSEISTDDFEVSEGMKHVLINVAEKEGKK